MQKKRTESKERSSIEMSIPRRRKRRKTESLLKKRKPHKRYKVKGISKPIKKSKETSD